MRFYFDIDLQLFGEGGDGAGVTGSDAGSQSTGEAAQAAAPAAGEQTSRNLDAEFEDLIKGEYKEVYGKRVQDTVQKRLKGTNETIEKYNAIAPVFELLAGKYGVDPSDINSLSRAIEEDNTYYEDEAIKRGISVEQYKSIRKMERENAAYRAEAEKAREEASTQRILAQWMQDGEKVKAIYGSFDFDTEMQNPDFQKLLGAGVDVKSAFEVIHKDDLINGVMQKTAAAVRQQTVNDIQARGRRPAENGLASTASVHAKVDVNKMSKKERQELIRRAARGERVEL